MPEIRLVGTRLSPFVEKVASAAEYKRLRFRIDERPGLLSVARMNRATGKIPILFVDDELVYDSTFILRELDAIAPEPSLLSVDPPVAAAQRQLEDWSDESLYWHLMALRFAPPNAARSAAQLLEFVPPLARPVAKPLIRRILRRATVAQGLGRLPYEVLLREVGERLDDLVLLLGQRTFFYSSRPTIADFAIYGQFKTGCSGPTPDFERLVSERPTLADWMKRVADATHR